MSLLFNSSGFQSIQFHRLLLAFIVCMINGYLAKYLNLEKARYFLKQKGLILKHETEARTLINAKRTTSRMMFSLSVRALWSL